MRFLLFAGFACVLSVVAGLVGLKMSAQPRAEDDLRALIRERQRVLTVGNVYIAESASRIRLVEKSGQGFKAVLEADDGFYTAGHTFLYNSNGVELEPGFSRYDLIRPLEFGRRPNYNRELD
ncbi:TPA: hypothetical protein DDW35_02365 [Candidatus Sumerlaeota bacterium]|jgi:hypothetical protein|nr:hypothetical protein [Candidatus Sumerlaeota bacterium]